MNLRAFPSLLLAMSSAVFAAEEPAAGTAPGTGAETAKLSRTISPELKSAIEKLSLPGVKINTAEWCVDIESRVCLREGLLELIACTKDTKEHESIIMIEAKPSHAHLALLLLGTKPGNPAMQQAIDAEMTRFRHMPPRGGPVDVFLVFKDSEGKEQERPISEFIVAADRDEYGSDPETPEKLENFPTHTFLFAGSVLVGEDKGPRKYLCDQSGNVISISTFGDELLCLSGIHDHSNGALAWQANGDKLPEVDSKIILRLRPQFKPQPGAESGGASQTHVPEGKK